MLLNLIKNLDLVQFKSGTILVNDILSAADLRDYDLLAKKIAAVPHYFVGRNQTAYSPMVLGHYVNELVRRVDPKKRTIEQFIREEINTPLNVDFYYTVTKEELETKVGKIYPFPNVRLAYLAFNTLVVEPIRLMLGYKPRYECIYFKNILDDTNLMGKAFRVYEKEYAIDHVNTFEANSLLMPASHLKTNAHSIAKLSALIANGGEIDGVRLLSKATVDKMLEVQEPQLDHALNKTYSRVRGGWAYFDHNSDPEEIRGNTNYIGWQGFGGSVFYFNPKKQFGFSYVMNGLGSPTKDVDPRAIRLISTFYELIENDN